MRGCVLALHRGPVNVSVVWVRTLCLSPCGMRPRRAVRCVSMVWCLCCFVSVRRVPPPAGWLCALRAGRVLGGLLPLCAHLAAASTCSRADAVADLERVFPCAP
jgi:hypothetical protein